MALYARLLGSSTPTSSHIDPEVFIPAVVQNVSENPDFTVALMDQKFSLDSQESADWQEMCNILLVPGHSEGTIPPDYVKDLFRLGRAGVGFTTETAIKTELGLI